MSTLHLPGVHKPVPTWDLLCSSSSVSVAPGHCPLSLTLSEGEQLMLLLRVPFAGSPLLMPKTQPTGSPRVTVYTLPKQAGFCADMGGKACSLHP